MADTATRVSYGRALANLGGKYDFVVMDADLSGSTHTCMFAEKFPERFINCGIAEGNMISVAAGIATTGMPVFASSFAMFAAGRAFEQVRNSVGYPHLNVKICATHAGVTVGEDGGSHQCCEDIAIMRSIPGMTVVCPADDTEAYAAIEAILKYDGPVYCRLGRHPVPVVFDPESYKFELGKAVPVFEGNDCVVFATGVMVSKAIEAYDILKSEGINISVVNIHTIKPLDTETIIKYAAKTKHVVTAEEHSVIGGLGSAVCEVLSENLPTRLARVGIQDVFGRSGKAGELLEYYGLTGEGIAKKVRTLLGVSK
ncbi:MAG: transketolase family protein [Eubacteriales bacterium]|nr:transketolase family protein [Eubacteriales bacterium]